MVEEVRVSRSACERNEDYWDGNPALATAEVRYIVDGEARATQLPTGEVDIAATLPVGQVAEPRGD